MWKLPRGQPFEASYFAVFHNYGRALGGEDHSFRNSSSESFRSVSSEIGDKRGEGS
jgi:hypothetical protein